MSVSKSVKSRKNRKDLKSYLSKETVKSQFQDYCSSSSIHGVQYVGDFRRPLFERWWWFLIFILSSFLNGYLIYRVWAKWRDSPVIVAFRETTTPVWDVPFPAITICPQVNSRRHQFNLGESLKLNDIVDQEEEEKRAAISLLCEEELVINGSSPHLNQSMFDFLMEVAPNVKETLVRCDLRNMKLPCDAIFKHVITEDGLCFTSNMLNHSEIFRDNWSVEPYPRDMPEATYWSLDKGYSKSSPIQVFPRRGFDSGDRGGIYILITGNLSNHDSICKGPTPGYKVMLHNPAEIPLSTGKYIRIPTEQEVLVLVTPVIMTTSQNLRSYSPKVRQCFYPDERYLKYFKVYTERNCELECLTNYTLRRCGCASIYMPRDKSTPVCGGSMKNCTVNMAYELRMEELRKTSEGLIEDYCNCLPACTSITYYAETSQTAFAWRKAYEDISSIMFNDTDDVSSDFTLSRVILFFTDTQFSTTHRSELYGVIDFLANCGGLLGLFSGISVLSLLEILYFLTIRYWGNILKRKKPIQEHQIQVGLSTSAQD